ncbi:MAG: UxaA family hydrolase [Syntrophomonadaceae bacterium]|nr:UxaA family hydrolase [Syntrophomonadaceae bacterium]
MVKAVVIDPLDNVATSVEDIRADEQIVLDLAGTTGALQVKHVIPFGHKVAVRAIPCGSQVIKYGESIGTATQDIGPGEHVHVQNLLSNRGRGDLA